ncbi:histidine kinase [Tepidanaerobacter syntrophicus]|uniref:sensor histidine kinase n=1 Tax=Tepidanaerobacter syntrophicus TaxID=224999 RepID=UPI0022ED8CF3|nr:sensor histidine kinase [Tepidanaerobacter syntrophicus]GLI50941.1 histidine kinase [Tepidanaerobacter syntrophicus]
MTFQILLDLANRLGIFVIIAFLLSQFTPFKKLILKKEVSLGEKIILSAIFGSFGILGTYMGIPVYGALANSRAVGVIIGGLLGGPFVGVLSGLIASLHRWSIDIGGFTAVACAISTFIEATLAGFIHKKFENGKKICWWHGFAVGIAMELLQMVIILTIAKPFSAALELVKVIWFPMTFVNSCGIAIFILIIDNIFKEQEQVGALQAKLSLDIASETLPYLRKGLNELSAYKAAKIIFDKTDYDAVAVTDTEKILAHVGKGEDHHKAGYSFMTKTTKDVISSKEYKIATSKEEINCAEPSCPLQSAVVAPLLEGDKVIGCLKLYKVRPNSITSIDVKLAQGLARMFATQLELAKAENQAKLLANAERRALQAQINPHFLFNALNTIISVSRKNPDESRKLLMDLSEFFRKNLSAGMEMVPLEQEIEHVKAYLSIEQARFGERLKTEFIIEPNAASSILVPPLILQPLVENAVKHGIMPKKEGGKVTVKIESVNQGTIVSVEDNGIGMSEEILEDVKKYKACKDRIGLWNVNGRLESYFGKKSCLEIYSKYKHGTVVKFFIPCSRIPAIGCENHGA